jgi:HD superfamily phosphohydrolase
MVAGQREHPPATWMNANELRHELEKCAPNLWQEVAVLADAWAQEIHKNLSRRSGLPTAFPKTFTDPVLGPVELFEWEVAMLDSPLLQRLRGIRQLGMAHTVYTSALHDRLSHCLGVVEIASRMIQALEKNAYYRRIYGNKPDTDLPLPRDDDRFSIRLAALLHDIGHAPFSHATESLAKSRARNEFERIFDLLRTEFEGALHIKPSEAIAVLAILSEPLRKVFEHARFAIPFNPKENLAQAISARILGSRKYLSAPYLAGIVSGPVDADKLDYMTRDSYFTGLPIGLDVNRLINKLEIVTITPDNVLDKELKKRAQEAPNQRLDQLGISLSGLTAYEQMIVGRVLLYDRVYYHHKVRCGEAMVRRLFELAEAERKRPFSLVELFSNVTDDAMIYLLSGEMKLGDLEGGSIRSKRLGGAIRVRHFYHRAFAFAERFIAGLDGLQGEEEANTRSSLWMEVYENFDEQKLSNEIFDLTVKLREAIPELKRSEDSFGPEHVLVDLPDDRVTVPGRKLLVRTESGGLTDANLFFNPDKWSQAYKNQKQCGYVFTPKEYTEVVSLASQILFFQKYGLVMRTEALHLCKVEHLVSPKMRGWMDAVLKSRLCTPECFSGLTETRIKLLPLREGDIRLPGEWCNEDSDVKRRLVQEFFNALPGGLVASIRDSVSKGLEDLCFVLDALEKSGAFTKDERPDEKRGLQTELLKLLRARGVNAREGAEFAGGESDVILPGELILENKVADVTNAPHELKPDAAWQARRYSIALNRRISFVLIAYKPASEAALLPLPSRVSVYPLLNSPEACAVVRLLVPWGVKIPSRAKAV